MLLIKAGVPNPWAVVQKWSTRSRRRVCACAHPHLREQWVRAPACVLHLRKWQVHLPATRVELSPLPPSPLVHKAWKVGELWVKVLFRTLFPCNKCLVVDDLNLHEGINEFGDPWIRTFWGSKLHFVCVCNSLSSRSMQEICIFTNSTWNTWILVNEQLLK